MKHLPLFTFGRDRSFAIIVLLFLATFPSVLQAQFTYIITTNLTVTITGYTGAGGPVIVPSTLTGFPVTIVQSQTFQYNGNITDVLIPNTVSNLGSRAFLACWSLVAINVDPNNQYYSSAGGVLFDKTQTQLIEYPPGKAGSYIVPANVMDIGVRAFESCPGLASVSCS